MPSTSVRVVAVDAESPYLDEVISMGRANAATLGFLPKGAFVAYAVDNRVLVALGEDEQVLGYLVYATSVRKALAYIVHLCVHKSYRGQGIARALFEEMKRATKDQVRGIRVRCRRDYEASELWPKLGFIAGSEMPGRSRRGTTLTVWWFDHGHPTLFTYAEENRQQSKFKAAIDANVFFQLREPPDSSNEESQALLATWLQEDVELCLTNEIFNEIHRHPDAEIRRRERAFANGFVKLTGSDEDFQKTCEALQTLFPERMSVSDESDLRQLAWSIAANAQFFVTRDNKLLVKDDQIHNAFGIRVIRPADLVINQDQLMRETEYYPARLAGSQVKTERIRSGEASSLESVFRAPQEETKAKFQQRLNACLSDPRAYEAHVVRSTDKPLALIVHSRQTQQELEIPLFRLVQGSLAATLARHLVVQSVLTSSKEGRVLTRITDPYLSDVITDALQQIGFVLVGEAWTKANPSSVETSGELATRLASFAVMFPPYRQYFEQMTSALTAAHSRSDILTLLQVERSLWPTKVIDLDIPTFIVSIHPIWAMHLFDSGIANQDLFGGEPSLMLSVENVYYRARRPEVLSAPARVLWYVTKGRGRYQDTMAIRACSYIDEVVVDKPRALFSRFRRLGVYQWEDVFEVAKQDTDQEIMAFRFSNTEVFDHPIPWNKLQEIWRTETEKGLNLQSPAIISAQRFFDLYKKGIGLV
jgi:GNAT superfamily N-acetyltransferase/predicted nucleic acid-binding protein